MAPTADLVVSLNPEHFALLESVGGALNGLSARVATLENAIVDLDAITRKHSGSDVHLSMRIGTIERNLGSYSISMMANRGQALDSNINDLIATQESFADRLDVLACRANNVADHILPMTVNEDGTIKGTAIGDEAVAAMMPHLSAALDGVSAGIARTGDKLMARLAELDDRVTAMAGETVSDADVYNYGATLRAHDDRMQALEQKLTGYVQQLNEYRDLVRGEFSLLSQRAFDMERALAKQAGRTDERLDRVEALTQHVPGHDELAAKINATNTKCEHLAVRVMQVTEQEHNNERHIGKFEARLEDLTKRHEERREVVDHYVRTTTQRWGDCAVRLRDVESQIADYIKPALSDCDSFETTILGRLNRVEAEQRDIVAWQDRHGGCDGGCCAPDEDGKPIEDKGIQVSCWQDANEGYIHINGPSGQALDRLWGVITGYLNADDLPY